ncbi:MAG: 23S rRNA (uracil(1939)-C(5))-methyltransferase RlmD, partial [Anaerolineae bacterium]|nr:23S rRNA (uracil(1939)-C(5))-methyltransferase RlmD [Anaerolineae bacterium]
MNDPQSVELDLNAPAYGGSIIARHQGRAIFVPYGVPDETVRAHIVSDKGSYAFADIDAVLVPSPARVVPPCSYFGAGRCGGCHYQHIDYAAQLVYKHQIVAEQFARVGKLPDAPVLPTLAAPAAWNYRAHATF